MKKDELYCCEEHLDRAFDDFLAEFESFPVMIEAHNNESCTYCSEQAKYVLRKQQD